MLHYNQYWKHNKFEKFFDQKIVFSVLLKKYFHLEDLVSPEKQKKLVWGDQIIRKIDFPPVSIRSFSSGKKVVLSSKHKEISSKYKNFFSVENQLFLESIKKILRVKKSVLSSNHNKTLQGQHNKVVFWVKKIFMVGISFFQRKINFSKQAQKKFKKLGFLG